MELPFDEAAFTVSVLEENLIWRKHTLEKMLERSISRFEVLKVLQHGEVIQVYDFDKPFPSILMLGFPGNRPIHVVASFDEVNQITFVITAYEPDPNIFESDFKTKKKKL